MKHSMKSKVNEIGNEVVAKREEKTQSEKPTKGVSGLESLVADEKAANEYFLQSDNERALTKVEQPTQADKSKNEDMFK